MQFNATDANSDALQPGAASAFFSGAMPVLHVSITLCPDAPGPSQGAIYRVDMADAEPEPQLFRRIATKGFSPDDFETKQARWGSGCDGGCDGGCGGGGCASCCGSKLLSAVCALCLHFQWAMPCTLPASNHRATCPPAGVCQQQGRHPGPHVCGAQARPAAGRHQFNSSVWLRRLQQ